MTNCLKAVEYARILLVGRGLSDNGAPNPQFADIRATLQLTWENKIYLLTGTDIKVVCRKFILQGSNQVSLEKSSLFGLELSKQVGFKYFDILTIARCGFISVSCANFWLSEKSIKQYCLSYRSSGGITCKINLLLKPDKHI